MFGGRLVGGGGEVLVAAAALAALGDAERLAGMGEIVEALAGGFVVDHGADGHLDFDAMSPSAPVRLLPSPWRPRSRLVFGVEAELQQGVGVLAAHQDDVAAAAAIAAAGAAARDVLLPAEGEAAVAAVAGLYENSDFVDKHRKAAGTLKPAGLGKAAGQPVPAARSTERRVMRLPGC